MQEIVTLHAPGAIPGIPGESHGPGTFLVDYEARTIEEVKPPETPVEQPSANDTPPEQGAE